MNLDHNDDFCFDCLAGVTAHHPQKFDARVRIGGTLVPVSHVPFLLLARQRDAQLFAAIEHKVEIGTDVSRDESGASTFWYSIGEDIYQVELGHVGILVQWFPETSLAWESRFKEYSHNGYLGCIEFFVAWLPASVLTPCVSNEELGDARELADARLAQGERELRIVAFFLWCVLVAIFNTQRERLKRTLGHRHTK